MAVEAEIFLELLGYLPHKTLEGTLSEEELGGLLVAPDLPKSDGSRAIPVRLLGTTRRVRGSLARNLGGELLAWGQLCRRRGWLRPRLWTLPEKRLVWGAVSGRCLSNLLGACHVWIFWSFRVGAGYLFVLTLHVLYFRRKFYNWSGRAGSGLAVVT